ncbi:DUF1761 domain-containing protein, partial [candidate division WWE3 bacterium]|nr:DUF1761 domain-containing protein [candidate division WWE3 bacterium]
VATGYHLVRNILLSPSPMISFRPEITLLDSLLLGCVVWLLFIVPTGFFHVLFAQKPLQLWALDSFYWLAALLATATISTVWPY